MSPSHVRILVASSERKRRGGARVYTFEEAQAERSTNRFNSLTDHRRQAISGFLAAINGQGHSGEVLRAQGPILEEAKRLNLGLRHSPLLPVIEREVGPLFRALDAGSLPRRATRRLKERLMVVCPLLGVLAPTDLVPEYRCPVAAKIPGSEFGSLHNFWKPRLSPLLDRLCRGRLVFCFLPGRLRALWRPRRPSQVVTVRFMRRSGGRDISEHAGGARATGELVRYLLVNDVSGIEDLHGFCSSADHRFEGTEEEEGGAVRLRFVRGRR